MTSDAHASLHNAHMTPTHTSLHARSPKASPFNLARPYACSHHQRDRARPQPACALLRCPYPSLTRSRSPTAQRSRACAPPTPTPTNSARRAHVSEGYPHGYPRWCSCSCAGALHAWSHCMHRANGSSGRTSGSEIIPDTADPVTSWGTHARAWPRASPPGSRQTGGAPRGQPLRCSRMYPPSSGGT